MDARHKLDAKQIENVLDRLVPMIAKPEDAEFFRGVLGIVAENSSSGAFASLVHSILTAER